MNQSDGSVRNTVQMGPKFISTELRRNIACVSQKLNKKNKTEESLPMAYSNMKRNWGILVLEGRVTSSVTKSIQD